MMRELIDPPARIGAEIDVFVPLFHRGGIIGGGAGGRGVTEEQITTMLVDNPRAIFSHGGGY